MRSIWRAASAQGRAPTQMIWFPGAYDGARDFLDQGFARAAANRCRRLDLLFVDLEMTHLGDRAPLETLRSEIVLPARTAGASVWLAGISLGGMAALDYASNHPGEIDGLYLLAPYLGNRMLIDEIAAGRLAESDTEHRIWRYIARRVDAVPMYLGYGREDRFSRAHELMAAAMPAQCVDVIEGGHDWRTWSRLWERFLDSHFA
jgi:pimeloyl-ACP methyl ester carboxylesterase